VDRCLWIEDVAMPGRPAADLPGAADVVVVGGGYTGLSAARTLARHGVDTVVLEGHTVGWGASGRNGGFVLPGFQPGLGELVRRGGMPWARALFQRSLEAVRYLESILGEEGIACDYARNGAVVLAGRPSHLRRLEAEQRVLRDVMGYETVLLERAALGSEIGSDRYHGGLMDPGAGSLHPARYCAGLARAAERAGARVVEQAGVRRVRRGAGRLEVETVRGTIRASQVLVATNGYTGAPFDRLRRRVIPIGSYIVATAPLDPALARRLVPGGRVLSDTWHLLHYFRLSPDERMVFGGRASFTPIGTARSARLLGAAMREVFPQLGEVPVDFAWSGSVGFTLDRLPHAGRIDGVHYALGYCGHGVALSTWLGARMGAALAGAGEAPDLGRLRAIPLYGGRPWFLPLVGGYYRMRDWMS
jgi:glycine/D-amino acid oxidase-like deaminating enzyme